MKIRLSLFNFKGNLALSTFIAEIDASIADKDGIFREVNPYTRNIQQQLAVDIDGLNLRKRSP